MARTKSATRRRFIALSGGLGVATLAGCLAPAAEDDAAGATDSGASDEGDEVHEVLVGPDDEFVFTPGTAEPLEVEPGDTVRWLWESDTHNVVPTEIPAGSTWAGQQEIEDEGFEYEFTFEVEGHYHYVCEPHESSGMVADLLVGDVADDELAEEDGDGDADADGDEDTDGDADADDETGDDEAEAEFYTFDDPVDATGKDIVEIETRAGEGGTNEPNFLFEPHHVRVDVGATIRWTNTDGVFHTVTSTDDIDTRRGGGETFDSTISSEGDTFEWEAADAGEQPYYCSPHAGFMYGLLEIE
ncbi:plastocyanin/azurin family copper-binding protein [Natronosalvus amylolyticus]|uniref:plastocyanin/azurin family copper-binding protein n=1 Tax=Natronosalvus amylolyticus TaxID=2961994 RepID=UPI0020C9C160|nr:plastocyanin/azurin family copper-binding protein [Natronosalvus amylolyticus]